MILRSALRRIPLLLVVGSLESTMASNLLEWEDAFDESRAEEGAARGFADERSQSMEEDTTDVVEVTISPKRQNFVSKPNRDLAMVPVSSKGQIIDETKTTGENAKKKLPSYMMQNKSAEPSLLHEIHQVTTNLITMNSLEKAE